MTASLLERTHGPYVLSSDKSKLDLDLIHRYLAEDSYWAQGRERATVARSIEHSCLVMAAYDGGGAQVAFARMVTDLATWAWRLYAKFGFAALENPTLWMNPVGAS